MCPWAPLEVAHLPPGLPVRLHPREPASVPQHAACPGQTVAREHLPTHPHTRAHASQPPVSYTHLRAHETSAHL
eukprot:495866-Alexandrium_andersonii.AAC.1